jgi:flagellar biosynthesis chaperone FliJ
VHLSKINNPNINKVINEYKKLNQTKSNMNDIIGVCNYKIRENYIKRIEFEYHLSLIKDSYLKKLDDSLQDLHNVLNELKTQKEKIENSIGSIPNGFNNIVTSNDHVQGGIISEELKKLNKFDQNLENNIKQMAKTQPRMIVENYQTDFLDIPIPFNCQYNEGLELLNMNLNFIPNNKCVLIVKYLENKVFISMSIDINMPLNSFDFPKFYCYITIQNQKYGLEFNNLPAQSFPQDVIRQNNRNRNSQQINTTEIDFGQFMFLAGDNKKIKMKIYAMKVYFKN